MLSFGRIVTLISSASISSSFSSHSKSFSLDSSNILSPIVTALLSFTAGLEPVPKGLGAGLKPPGFLENAPPPKPPPIFFGELLPGGAFCF